MGSVSAFLFPAFIGTADQIPEFLGQLALADMRLRTVFDRRSLDRLRKEIRECLPVAVERQMLRYVPTRILRVFFEERGQLPHRTDRIFELAEFLLEPVVLSPPVGIVRRT
jgi:hypothetical protein